ncbi:MULTISPECIES: flagellar motor switch protein FliG [Zhongshania]|jgi:flagellar motor switch protein FliG|uniref:Flagellar motor switch protein FliG n=1 Tax=Zhongshania aquimaris TaxID=2857107 RepID=A0ABS6VTG5_9GAMM|nr:MULTISPECIES: flagellar motor switch protein FliG [Zhongshania]MBQ0797223.1 flagellar motor switch protein FliG [Zhongshania sp.]MBW2941600.1 flagellar motor switch protein FliG [Zhongshania aquimaris]
MANPEMAMNSGSKGSEKAALFLLMLGEEQASKVLKFVEPYEVERIGTAMASIRSVDNRLAEAVVDEFRTSLHQETSLGVGVQGYVRKLFTSTLGDQKGTTMADRVLGDEETQEMSSLRWLEPEALLHMMQDEHPQIIAITMAHMDQAQAVAVLKQMPPALQDDIVLRIANMQTIPQSAMRQLQTVLKKKLSVTATFKNRKIDGAMTVAGIMNGLDPDSETRILEAVAKENQTLSERIQDLMFVFGNLVNIPDKGIQLLLREVGSDVLPLALKGADEQVREKILGNMSKRAREMLLEDMDSRGPMKLSDVEAAQKDILAVARKLADAGQIDLGRGGDDYV